MAEHLAALEVSTMAGLMALLMAPHSDASKEAVRADWMAATKADLMALLVAPC